MAKVLEGHPPLPVRWLRPLETWIYRVGGVKPDEEMSWKRYFWAVVLFNVVGLLTIWGLQMVQAWLPLNPQKFGNVPWALALNTAISFITNTNWQAYSGESTLSYLSQMAGLAVHNFLSAPRALRFWWRLPADCGAPRRNTLGSFWVD